MQAFQVERLQFVRFIQFFRFIQFVRLSASVLQYYPTNLRFERSEKHGIDPANNSQTLGYSWMA